MKIIKTKAMILELNPKNTNINLELQDPFSVLKRDVNWWSSCGKRL